MLPPTALNSAGVCELVDEFVDRCNYAVSRKQVCALLGLPYDQLKRWRRVQRPRPVCKGNAQVIKAVYEVAVAFGFPTAHLGWDLPAESKSQGQVQGRRAKYSFQGLPYSRLTRVLGADRTSLRRWIPHNAWPSTSTPLGYQADRLERELSAFLKWYRGEHRHALKLSFWLLSDGLAEDYFLFYRKQTRGLPLRVIQTIQQVTPDVPVRDPERLSLVLEWVLHNRLNEDKGVPVRWYQALRPKYLDHVLSTMARPYNPFFSSRPEDLFKLKRYGCQQALIQLCWRPGEPDLRSALRHSLFYPQWAWRVVEQPEAVEEYLRSEVLEWLI